MSQLNNDIIIKGNGWQFTYDDKGEYTTKALPIKIIQVHGEQPPFDVCCELEKSYSDFFDKHLKQAMGDINRYLKVHHHAEVQM